MKDYKKKLIEGMSFNDQAEVLNVMKPCITVTLDYLIISLNKGIDRKTEKEDTIKKWRDTRDRLEAIRRMY